MVLYALRHKESGKFMPLLKKNRGYSHWNPSNATHRIVAKEVGVPRLLKDERQALKCLNAWADNPNAEYRGYTNHHGEDDYNLLNKPDGRTRNDLEIVKVRLNIK